MHRVQRSEAAKFTGCCLNTLYIPQLCTNIFSAPRHQFLLMRDRKNQCLGLEKYEKKIWTILFSYGKYWKNEEIVLCCYNFLDLPFENSQDLPYSSNSLCPQIKLQNGMTMTFLESSTYWLNSKTSSKNWCHCILQKFKRENPIRGRP